MVYDPTRHIEACLICGSKSNTYYEERGHVVQCERCGDFRVDPLLAAQWERSKDERTIALASHLIRKMQQPAGWPTLNSAFFVSVSRRSLPTPTEAMDNFVIFLGESAQGKFGSYVRVIFDDKRCWSEIGIIGENELIWIVRTLNDQNIVDASFDMFGVSARLSANGWERLGSLRSTSLASRYAFFARKFDNPELDCVFADCLFPAVKGTGYELRTVTQKAGPVDAIIEDEIRRCRFLIADLTDENNGAYWEAGFAEGLGKPVIYICRDTDKDTGEPLKTHFDTDHRHTVRWNLNSLDETAKQLKAVIRNTLLGDANQSVE
jgi:hypothetical protein